ncbi:hypothetical protein HII36_03810 [Nonomuraea sp. NN258]|uniref:hypothetical protein n=1 Tax=Nonomuraea antri TaxID=2730852 RepID=UPI001569FB4C|nr:hypothetical protein [Nonomuraea antri]NRQ30959.1 hypothetical protein [Nonomuraea antri]
MSRHVRPPGTLPRPLAFLGAVLLVGGTAMAISVLPAPAEPEATPAPRAATVSPPPATSGAEPAGPAGFVAFVDTALDPGLDLAAESRRSGVRWYELGHVIAGGDDGCSPRWATSAAPGASSTAAQGVLAARARPLGERLGRLRAAGGEAGPVFGGPAGREPAAACTRPGALAALYRRVVVALDARYVGFEVRDSADRATVLRRARAVHQVQRERPLRVAVTLPLGPYGLSAEDAAMLRLTRRAGVRIDTVGLLARIEPQTAPDGRMRRLAAAVRAARTQIDAALGDSGGRIALTSVLTGSADLSELDARKLVAYADRHRLAWLSLRGQEPAPEIARILWHPPR